MVLAVKNLPRSKRLELNPWVGKIPLRRALQPTPVFLPGESHGQRSLMGYSPWGCKELGTTEATECAHTHTHTHTTTPWKNLKIIMLRRKSNIVSFAFL